VHLIEHTQAYPSLLHYISVLLKIITKILVQLPNNLSVEKKTNHHKFSIVVLWRMGTVASLLCCCGVLQFNKGQLAFVIIVWNIIIQMYIQWNLRFGASFTMANIVHVYYQRSKCDFYLKIHINNVLVMLLYIGAMYM